MAIPRCIIKASEAIHRAEQAMEEKSASAALQVLNQDSESKVFGAIHKFDLALIKRADNFFQSLVHRDNK